MVGEAILYNAVEDGEALWVSGKKSIDSARRV